MACRRAMTRLFNPKEEFALNQKPEMKPENRCAVTEGMLPGCCAPMVFPFIAEQETNSPRYDADDALKNGTLFPGLNLPFHMAMQNRFPTVPKALAELMALDFAIDELGLYLDTHPDDMEALDVFNSYISLAKQGRARYESAYGPLAKRYISEDGKYTWINSPWPWEKEGEMK